MRHDYDYSLRIASTILPICSFVGLEGCGVIAMPPVTLSQLPLPPLITFSTSVSRAEALPLYLAATSFHAGPTTLWSTAWHARQSPPNSLVNSTGPAAATPEMVKSAVAVAAAMIVFISTPYCLVYRFFDNNFHTRVQHGQPDMRVTSNFAGFLGVV